MNGARLWMGNHADVEGWELMASPPTIAPAVVLNGLDWLLHGRHH